MGRMNIIYRVCQITAIGLMATGFALAQVWSGVILTLALVLLGWIGNRAKWNWISTVILLLYTSTAAAGIWLEVSPALLIAGVILALGCWEWNDQDHLQSTASNLPGTLELGQARLKLLAVTIGLSCVVVGAGLFLHIRLPFVIQFLLAVMVTYCFFRLYRLFRSLQGR